MEKPSSYSISPKAEQIDNVESSSIFSNVLESKLGKKALVLFLSSAVMLSSSFLVGCGNESNATQNGNSYDTSDTLKPGETATEVTVETEKAWEYGDPVFESASDMGAKKFIESYGNYFADPVSVYNAEVTYESENDGQSLIINPEYIEAYDFGLISSEKSPLGFEIATFPIDREITPENVKAFFDDYVRVQFDTYMNLIAKNPSPEAQMVIDREFANHCLPIDTTKGELSGFDIYSELGLDLMNMLKSEALKYDGTANFSTYQSSGNLDYAFNGRDVEYSYISNGESDDPIIISDDGSNQFAVSLILRQEVDVFEKKNITRQLVEIGDETTGFRIVRDRINGGNSSYTDIVSIE